MTPILAVIQFPGSNCERETITAAEDAGFSVRLVRWNSFPDTLSACHAVILPGGFSFQDRIRTGVVASRLPIIETLKKMSRDGCPILGICNGCQILTEAGLIPSAALGPNYVDNAHIGHVCDWVSVTIRHPEKCIFTRYFKDRECLPIPINHGAGQFIFDSSCPPPLATRTILQYSTPNGTITPGFPINPNGSQHNIAGISNADGNILALMPHPERAVFAKQHPQWVTLRHTSTHRWSWKLLFTGMRDAVHP